MIDSIKIGLGTVQFGMNYGINNNSGRPSLPEVKQIINLARDSGVDILDTASSYGESERVIGSMIEISKSFKIVTKCLPINHIKTKEVKKEFDYSFKKSLINLNRESVYGLLIHNVNDLFSKEGKMLYSLLSNYKNEGYAKKIGASVYNPEQAKMLIKNFTCIKV